MDALWNPARHEPLAAPPWDDAAARDRIAARCRDAEAAFDPARMWPTHPRDDEPGGPADGVLRGVHVGAAGMLHALARLAAAGFHEPAIDLAAAAVGLHEPASRMPDEEGAGPSLLVGSSGILLVEHELAPSARAADALAADIEANVEHPANEVLLGAPGTMLAARAMFARTGEERFRDLWQRSARVLLARREPDGTWTQDIYGTRCCYVGAGHGFAGNVRALLDAPEWLDDPAEVESRAVATLGALADVDGGLANWLPLPGRPDAVRVQWCHGAPGIAISLATRLAPHDDGLTALLEKGGELTWRAGPIAGSACLCHGTGGNGFAFLALHARTGDERWLERARTFAMHALDQAERLRDADGRGRYTLGTGEIGAALLAAACIDLDARFPGIDDW